MSAGDVARDINTMTDGQAVIIAVGPSEVYITRDRIMTTADGMTHTEFVDEPPAARVDVYGCLIVSTETSEMRIDPGRMAGRAVRIEM